MSSRNERDVTAFTVICRDCDYQFVNHDGGRQEFKSARVAGYFHANKLGHRLDLSVTKLWRVDNAID